MALLHTLPNEAVDVAPLGDRLPHVKTHALFKARDLEVMRVVLTAGKSLPPHKVEGEITIQCIEGVIDVTAEGERCTLRPGQLLYLPGDVMHAVEAIEDASALVTVVLQR